ncbi:helix-turn-helix domain-containing protein [Polaribacter ponticola]|uniref:Helix-turn-helix domain-containing protein n=1 Tax=Polaribacter ponticola TaxID=2978475 RepID=A0ABT5S6U1_9FLAO|nr:helix-turn-helix domain-containing protein [Polaribacter sp. MSW5]MDD7913802.1 helix-turn-helix domain-containing protein [Polaribacter sp. MSW5]MDD7913814.1 helix-turn-helix domain-containing protein [Polaribacter sp. MSW5]
MNNQNLAIKIKNLRNQKGFSQEQLAEESKLSLRTIQRIEKTGTISRGDTLIKITQALNITPDELLEWEVIEDKGYIQQLNWSSLFFIIHPILGIIIPFIMWILKKGKIKYVDDCGKKIVNFQITWVLTLYVLLIPINMWFGEKFLSFPFSFNIKNSIYALIYHFSIPTIMLFLLYLINIVFIILNVRKSRRGLRNEYILAIPFLK